MAERPEIADKIVDIIAKKMDKPKEDIQLGMSFVNDLGADSLDQVEIIMEIEDAFGLNIPEEDAEKIDTIGQAVNYVEQKMQAGASE